MARRTHGACWSMRYEPARFFRTLEEGATISQHIGRFDEVLLLEDNSTAAERRRLAGVGSEDTGQTITVRVHRLNGASKVVVARKTYEAGTMRTKRSAKIELATKLIDRAANGGTKAVIVTGTSYGSASGFLQMLGERDLSFVVQIRPSTVVQLKERGRPGIPAAKVLDRGKWRGHHGSHARRYGARVQRIQAREGRSPNRYGQIVRRPSRWPSRCPPRNDHRCLFI
jgi:hypothetical protein